MSVSPEFRRVDRYDLLETLGRGALSVIYKARDPELGRTVVLKLIAVDDEHAMAQLRHESRAAASIAHRNILRVLDIGRHERYLFVVSPFVEGGSLANRLSRFAPLPIDEALRIADDVGCGLAALHRQHLVHRDLKPSNILIEADGTAVVTDLGLALSRGSSGLTASGMVFGTPHYMSPEQISGGVVDARSDLFAFGVVVYEMLSGRRPFEGTDPGDVLQRIVSGARPVSPREWNQALPAALAEVLLRSIAAVPAHRYDTAESFVAALRAATPTTGDGQESPAVPALQSQSSLSDWSSSDQDTRMLAPLSRRQQSSATRVDDAPAWLLITDGPRAGERIPIRTPLVFGRTADADVQLDDKTISRRHARVEPRTAGFALVDLSSQNGVFVNGERVVEARLQDGDQIGIGAVTCTFVIGSGAPSPSAVVTKGRVLQFDADWEELSSAVADRDAQTFADVAGRLVAGPLREAIGYRVEDNIPTYRGIAGSVVNNAMLWIRHSRFPILFVAYDRHREILSDLVRQVELAKVGTYFALVIVVPAEGMREQAASLRQSFRDSVYRYDFVVLTREHVRELVEGGTSRSLVRLIMDQGVDLGSLSPYVVRGPVPETMFFGREREVKLIAQSSAAYAVVGGRRIGKSSMLMKLKRLFGYDPAIEPVYLNCEDKFDLQDFLEGMTDALDVGPIADLKSLRPALKASARRSGKQLVCLLDEVDELVARDVNRGGGARLLQALRALAFEEQARFVLSGSRTLNRLGHDPKSPLFNFCEWMIVGMLDARIVTEILTKPLEQLGFRLTDPSAIVTRMMRATGGHPNLVQWLCDRLVRTTGGQRITLATLEQAADNPAYHEHLIETMWGDASPVERLASLVMSTTTFSRIDYETAMQAHGVHDPAVAGEALATLRLFSVVEGYGSHYRFINEEFPSVVRSTLDVEREIADIRRELET